MRCPWCPATLAPQPAGRKGTLHACPERHGVFATDEDLAHVLPVAAHATLRDAMARGAPADLACPACGTGMARYGATRGHDHVELDSCPACRGTWFDAGELERVKRPAHADAPRGAPADPHARAFAGGAAWGGEGAFSAIGYVIQTIAALLGDW